MPISLTNREILSRCIEAWLFLIEDLMLRQGLREPSRIVRSSNFIRCILQNDFSDILAACETAYTLLLTEENLDYTAFKQQIIEAVPALTDLEGLLSPLSLTLSHFLIESESKQQAHLLTSLAQFLRFPRKLEFQDIGLETKALEDYKETEQELAAMQYDDEEILEKLSSIIKEWFYDFHIKNLLPVHGTGSVAEGPLTLSQKFKQIEIDKTIKVLLNHPTMNDDYLGFFPSRPGEGLVRCSRTIFVPKTASKLRTISMEPIALQYLQQGVMHELYRFIDNHPYLGVRIRLGSQDQNQYLALEGSLRQNYGTIDLSKASDTVSWRLVKRIFHSVPSLYKWLLGTRSSRTRLPDGEILQLEKFAPMGSALCFPIECIIFSAIVEYASRMVSSQTGKPSALWSVYGDDLIVDSACYEETIRILQLCGFTVNKTKSYNHGKYRESCGREYWAGYDITPLYYRTSFYRKRPSPSAYGSWCSSANNALFHRLPLYRWYLITKILSAKCNVPYFTSNPEVSPFLYSPEPTNFLTKTRWNKDLQRFEGRFITVKSRQRDGEVADDAIAYFCKLVELARRSNCASTTDDEPSSPYALHGCVEYFSSTVLPLNDYIRVNRMCAVDWGIL